MVRGEKRRFSRICMEGRVRLACAAETWDSRLLDISLKGALIEQPKGWHGKIGDRCRLQVVLRDSEVTIVMEAVVAHVNDGVMGFRCERIDLAGISHLRRLVELNLGDEGVLARELGELVAPSHPSEM